VGKEEETDQERAPRGNKDSSQHAGHQHLEKSEILTYTASWGVSIIFWHFSVIHFMALL